MIAEGALVTVKEADRAAVMLAVLEKRLKQREAAARLGLSARQVKRLAKRYRERGAAGMASGRRGAPSNRAFGERAFGGRAFGEEVRREALRSVRERYADFGPTFAAEKLSEDHGLSVSRETLRKWMAEEGLWRPKRRRAGRVHQSRPRRARPLGLEHARQRKRWLDAAPHLMEREVEVTPGTAPARLGGSRSPRGKGPPRGGASSRPAGPLAACSTATPGRCRSRASADGPARPAT